MIIGKSLTALGGGGLKPEIRVTAKAGALLNLHYKDSSIILQSYQLGADETQHTFVVNENKTAYVIDDATNGKSIEVLVDTVAQYNVQINYRLYIIESGIENTDLTGGLTIGEGVDGHTGTIVRNSDNFYVYNNGGYRWRISAESVKTIDSGNRTKLYLDFQYYAANTSNGWLSIAGGRSEISVYSMSNSVKYPQSTRQTVSVDVKESSATWWFSMANFNRSSNSGNFTIYNMWFE